MVGYTVGRSSLKHPIDDVGRVTQAFTDRFILWSIRFVRAREFELLKQGSTTFDEYDTKIIWLSRYAPHLVLNERGKIRLFVKGLCRSLYQSAGPQIGIYPTHSTMVDTTQTMEMKEKKDDKQKMGFEGKLCGSSGASKPPIQG